jgi:hypothetical protein
MVVENMKCSVKFPEEMKWTQTILNMCDWMKPTSFLSLSLASRANKTKISWVYGEWGLHVVSLQSPWQLYYNQQKSYQW